MCGGGSSTPKPKTRGLDTVADPANTVADNSNSSQQRAAALTQQTAPLSTFGSELGGSSNSTSPTVGG